MSSWFLVTIFNLFILSMFNCFKVLLMDVFFYNIVATHVLLKSVVINMHQIMQMPNTQMINKTDVRKIAYEIKGWKKVNWCVLAKWTICDQLCRL
jgi:hypothetical protein